MGAVTNAIEQHLAEDAATDRLVQVLADFLSEDLDTLYARDHNQMTGTPSGSSDPWTPGIYLPDPAVIYRQAAPTTNEDKGIGDAVLYVGPTGEAIPVTPDKALGGGDTTGFVWQMNQTFAASIVFGIQAGQSEAYDPLTGRPLRGEEIVKKRASYYAGALAHTVFSRGFGTVEIWGTKPGPRASGQVELPVDGEEYLLVGVASYEFTVVNNQLFPPHVRQT